MDRNPVRNVTTDWASAVALRKESVDRNIIDNNLVYGHAVALRKESVDRNRTLAATPTMNTSSLSARRAWIEIANALPITSPTTKSLSARRAWIEIQ